MSFDDLRSALDELNIVVNSDEQKAEMKQIKQQNLELRRENIRVTDENSRLKQENSRLLDRAHLKEAEIQRRAEALTTDRWRRWLTEEKPTIVASAVFEEVKLYPLSCTASTRQVIDARAEQRLQEEMKEGFNNIIFGLSNGFKAINRQAATPRPIATVKPLHKAIIIKKPDEPK